MGSRVSFLMMHTYDDSGRTWVMYFGKIWSSERQFRYIFLNGFFVSEWRHLSHSIAHPRHAGEENALWTCSVTANTLKKTQSLKHEITVSVTALLWDPASPHSQHPHSHTKLAYTLSTVWTGSNTLSATNFIGAAKVLAPEGSDQNGRP